MHFTTNCHAQQNVHILLKHAHHILSVLRGYDMGMTFRQSSDNINTKAETRLTLLLKLEITSFAHFKQLISQTQKLNIRLISLCVHPAWQPDTSETHTQKVRCNTKHRTSNCHKHRKYQHTSPAQTNTRNSTQTTQAHEGHTSPPLTPPKRFGARTARAPTTHYVGAK